MNWSALKQYSCPKCGHQLKPEGLLSDANICSNAICTFRIGNTRLEEITKNLMKPRYGKSEESNLTYLNNLGHEFVGEDFSNSPHLQ